MRGANSTLSVPFGAGNVATSRAVTGAEVQALADPALAGVVVASAPGGFVELRTVAAGAAAKLQVRAATAAGFGLDVTEHTGAASGAANALRVEGLDPGSYANHLEAEVRAPTSGEAGACDLAIIEDGSYREVFPNLRMTPAADRYVERVVNARAGSALVRVVDQLLAGSPPPAPQTVTLGGGSDGLDLVYPKRINPLTTGPGLPRYIDGSRTLKGDGNFPYVAERRGVIFIERSLKQGLQFARHKNNTEGLRATVRRWSSASPRSGWTGSSGHRTGSRGMRSRCESDGC